MRLRRLCKAASSMGGDDERPAVYESDDPLTMIAQGPALDAGELRLLQDLATDETALRIPTGRPELQIAIEQYATRVEATVSGR